MGRTPNYRFERSEREKKKERKKLEKMAEQAERTARRQATNQPAAADQGPAMPAKPPLPKPTDR